MLARSRVSGRWDDSLFHYYEMTHGVYGTKIEQLFGSPESVKMDGCFYFPDFTMMTSSLGTFQLMSTPNTRNYKSVEILVTLSDVTELTVGWGMPSKKKPPQDTISMDNPPRVGSYDSSIGLDLVRFGIFFFNGDYTQLDKGPFETEPTLLVRCEEYGKVWFVNNQKIHSLDRAPLAYPVVPVITGLGKWKIKKPCVSRIISSFSSQLMVICFESCQKQPRLRAQEKYPHIV